MNCLDSYDYLQAIRQLQNGQKLTDIDRFLLYTCWEYVPFVSTPLQLSSDRPKTNAVLQHLYDELLKRLEQAADQPPPFTPASFAYIFERCHQLLTIHNLASFDKHANYIVDRLITILKTQLTTDPQDQSLVLVTLQALHDLSRTPDIRAIIKKRELTSTIKAFTSTENSEQRKAAFGILAEIMDEKEINENPSEMTAIFVDQLKQLDIKEYDPNLDNTLLTLKGKLD